MTKGGLEEEEMVVWGSFVMGSEVSAFTGTVKRIILSSMFGEVLLIVK